MVSRRLASYHPTVTVGWGIREVHEMRTGDRAPPPRPPAPRHAASGIHPFLL